MQKELEEHAAAVASKKERKRVNIFHYLFNSYVSWINGLFTDSNHLKIKWYKENPFLRKYFCMFCWTQILVDTIYI